MKPGRPYQFATSVATLCWVSLAVVVANLPVSQRLLASMPVVSGLTPVVLSDVAFWRAAGLSVVVVLLACAPVFARPRRAIDLVALAGRRVLLGCLSLAAIGFLDYTFRLPRTTFVLITVFLCGLPFVLVAINDRFLSGARGTIVIGNDPERIARVLEETTRPIAGYVSPPIATVDSDPRRAPIPVTDGGAAGVRSETPLRLGDLTELSTVLGDYRIGRAVFAFSTPNRSEFFGALATCHDHGVSAIVRRECAPAVLTRAESNDFVAVDLEPWSWWAHLCRYCLDKCFALAGLLALAPLMAGIAVAIRLDGHGPILYSQERTTVFGRRFRLFKFRTMAPDSENATPVDDEANPSITRVGRFLRRTHLDEIPQLYSILVGDMSVVGPRAAWTEEEADFLDIHNGEWRKRWFVKPGLTGLAQINEVSSTNPELKLAYDVEYIRRQSFTLDIRIIAKQIWMVLADLLPTDEHRSRTDRETPRSDRNNRHHRPEHEDASAPGRSDGDRTDVHERDLFGSD